ncbi:MAG: methyltransferase domain-containing protein [Pyrinomonadaceae bacterium]
MDQWLRENIVCPRDRKMLTQLGPRLSCQAGHEYPIVDEIPILLLGDGGSTHGYLDKTLADVRRIEAGELITDVIESTRSGNVGIDPFVNSELQRTCGNLYAPAMSELSRYPIPMFPLNPLNGARLLDIGCNWGRWTIAAAKKSFAAVGIDPSLEAVLAARRVSRKLNISSSFVVGDARCLPFADSSFDTVFSYSVLQHFSQENRDLTLIDISRVLRCEGRSLIQMASRNGIRSRQQLWRRRGSDGEGFDVRYWRPSELVDTFQRLIGPTKLTADGYFGLNMQYSDIDLMPLRYKIVVGLSEGLRWTSRRFSPLCQVADSVFLESVNRKTT